MPPPERSRRHRRRYRSGDPLGYTEAFGRTFVAGADRCAYSRTGYGLDVAGSPGVAVTVGASGAFPLAFLAAFDPGDRVALAAPFYPPYVQHPDRSRHAAGDPGGGAGDAVPAKCGDAGTSEADPRPDGLIVASPCNPAGTMLHPDELAAIAGWCDAQRRAVDQR